MNIFNYGVSFKTPGKDIIGIYVGICYPAQETKLKCFTTQKTENMNLYLHTS